MKMIIQTPDFKASEKLMNFVRENVEKLGLLSDRILEGQVLLKKEKSDTNADKVCELKLVIPGNDIFASRRRATFEQAIMDSIQAVRPQIKKWKDNHDPSKIRGEAATQEEL